MAFMRKNNKKRLNGWIIAGAYSLEILPCFLILAFFILKYVKTAFLSMFLYGVLTLSLSFTTLEIFLCEWDKIHHKKMKPFQHSSSEITHYQKEAKKNGVLFIITGVAGFLLFSFI